MAAAASKVPAATSRSAAPAVCVMASTLGTKADRARPVWRDTSGMTRPTARVLALLDTLRYVEMGGRVSRAQAMIGTMLDLKPLLLVANREIKSVDRVRTRSRAIARMIEFVRAEQPVERLAVMHAQAPEEAEAIAAQLRNKFPDLEVPVGLHRQGMETASTEVVIAFAPGHPELSPGLREGR